MATTEVRVSGPRVATLHAAVQAVTDAARAAQARSAPERADLIGQVDRAIAALTAVRAELLIAERDSGASITRHLLAPGERGCGTRRVRYTLALPDGTVVSGSRDGTELAGSQDGTAPTTGSEEAVLTGPTGEVDTAPGSSPPLGVQGRTLMTPM